MELHSHESLQDGPSGNSLAILSDESREMGSSRVISVESEMSYEMVESIIERRPSRFEETYNEIYAALLRQAEVIERQPLLPVFVNF